MMTHPRARFELVIARYDESIEWSEPYRGVRTIYSKGPPLKRFRDDVRQQALRREAQPPPDDAYVETANVGREAHSYLTYIIDHYDALPEYIGFSQVLRACRFATTNTNATQTLLQGELDSAHDWIRSDYGPSMFTNMLEEAEGRGEGCSFPLKTDPQNPGDFGFAFDGGGAMMDKYTRTNSRHTAKNFGSFFYDVLGLRPEQGGHLLRFYPSGFMVVSRERVLQRSVTYYEALRRQVDYANDPVEGHYLERSWFYIFNCHA